MFKSKCIKHLFSLVLCISLIFIYPLISFAESSQSFDTSTFDYSCIVYDESGNSLDVTSDTKVFPNRVYLTRPATQFVFFGNSDYSRKQLLFFKIRNLSSSKEYNLKFSLAYNMGTEHSADFNIYLRYVSPSGQTLEEQQLFNSLDFRTNGWYDFDFNFRPLDIRGQAYTLYLVFDSEIDLSTANIMYFSPQIELIDINDDSPFFDLILDKLDIIIGQLTDLNTKIFDFSNSFNTNIQDLIDLQLSFDTSIGDILKFTDSFNTNISDILDITLDNIFSNLFNDIQISLFNINSSINNSNSTVNNTITNIENTVSNIYNELTTINNTISQVEDAVNNVQSAVDDMSDQVNTNLQDLINGPEYDNPDNSAAVNDFNQISDDLESADELLPELTSDDLNNVFDLSVFTSELNQGFIAFNNVFDIVLTSTGLTSVVVFALGFALAIYIIGRRLGS